MITKRQYKVLSFFLTRSLFFGLGISKIINLNKNDTWISAIIGTILGIVILSIIYCLRKNTKIFSNNIASFFIKVFLFLLASICLSDVIISLTTMTSSFLLPLTPPIIIGTSIMIALIYANKKGIQSFARVAEILIPISLFIFLIIVIASTMITSYENYLPMLYNNNISIIQGSIIFCILSTTPTLLLLIINNVDLNYKDSIIGYVIGTITIIITILAIIGILGPTLADILRYPEYLALKKLRFLNFIENLENILVFIWLFDLIVLGFISTFNIRRIINFSKSKVNKIIYILWLIILLYIGVYIFNRHYFNVLLLYKYEPIILGIIVILILLTLFMLKLKQKKAYHK